MTEPTPTSGNRAMNRPPGLHASLQRYIDNAAVAESYDDFFSSNNLFHYDTRVLDNWFREPATLLDLGCGTGRHLIHFTDRKFSVTGVDLNEHMLNLCREKIQRRQAMARLIQGDIRHLPTLRDGSFVYAICMFSTLGMLRGKDNRDRVLQEIRRLLKPGGRLAFHVHNAFYGGLSPRGLLWMLGSFACSFSRGLEFGDKLFKDYRGIPNMYLHTFTEGEIQNMLTAAGLTLLEIHPLNPARDGRYEGAFSSVHANGFIVHVQKPYA